MAVHRGALVVGTLPSGRVHSMRVGSAVSSGRALGSGRHHIAAVRRGPTLELYVDGALTAAETDGDGRVLDLGLVPAIRVAGGPRAVFGGEVTQLDFISHALNPPEIAGLASLDTASRGD